MRTERGIIRIGFFAEFPSNSYETVFQFRIPSRHSTTGVRAAHHRRDFSEGIRRGYATGYGVGRQSVAQQNYRAGRCATFDNSLRGIRIGLSFPHIHCARSLVASRRALNGAHARVWGREEKSPRRGGCAWCGQPRWHDPSPRDSSRGAAPRHGPLGRLPPSAARMPTRSDRQALA